MAYEIGTATDYKDLLAKLKTFVTTNAALVAAGQQWTVLRHLTPADGEHELILRGRGLGGIDQIFVGIQTYSYPAGPHYSWRLNGYTGFDDAQSFFTQVGALPSAEDLPAIILRGGSINYWFVANGRRIIVITQAGTYFQQAYLGLALPFGPSTFNAYPLFIGGSTTQYKQPVGYTHAGYADSFWNPRAGYNVTSVRAGMGNAYFRCGGWYSVNNLAAASQYDGQVTPSGGGRYLNTWPISRTTASGGESSVYFTPYRENLDGSYPIFPIVLFKHAYTASVIAPGIYAALDGVYATFNFSLSDGDTLAQAGRSFFVASGTVTNDGRRFALIELA